MKKTEGSNTEREDWERKTSTHREIDGERDYLFSYNISYVTFL